MKFILILLFISLGMLVPASAQPNLLNGIAVIVNEAVITYRDVYNAGYAADEEFLERRFASQPQVLQQKRRELMTDRIEDLVERKLILHEFKTSGYVMPESLLDNRFEKEIKNFGDRVTLTKTLQAQGLTFEHWKNRIREREIIDAMRSTHIPRDPVISPHKMEKYYLDNQDQFKVDDEVKLGMIVLTNRPSDSFYSAPRMAEEILSKLKEGAPFGDLARIYSQGSQSSEGGNWGWVERSVLRKDLAEKAFALKPGELSNVVEAPDGCYIMLVEDVRSAHVKSLSDVRGEVETTLKDQEIKRLRKQWIEKLKRKSFIRYF